MKLAIILSAFLLISTTAFSRTIYVPDHCSTIQGAIDVCSNGDTVIVRPGTYVEIINFVGKAITVKSEHGAAVTVIDGNQAESVVTFENGEQADSVLDGFTITNGDDYEGGGIYCNETSPVITNNTITGNSATYGGGIHCWNSSPIISDNTFTGNLAYQGGGGICLRRYSHSTVTNNLIAANTANFGGGIECDSSSPTITNNTITGNSAGDSGGGIFCVSGGSPIVTNTILWNNSATFGREIHIYSGNPVVTYCDVKGGWYGTGNIDADPLFADIDANDVHLKRISPCRNSGDNSAVTESNDFDGDPRIAQGTVDMGADEYYYHLYHVGEVIPGSTIEVKVVGYPAAPITLYLGSGIADPPYNTQHGKFWLDWPPLWHGNIGIVNWHGILVYPATVPTTWTPGSEHPLQALVGPWGGSWTQLTNAEVLIVE